MQNLNALISKYGFNHKKVLKYAKKLNLTWYDLKEMQYPYLVTIEDALGSIGSWSCREEWYNNLEEAFADITKFSKEIRYAIIKIKDNKTHKIIKTVITE